MVGVVGIITIIPTLNALVGVFDLGQIVWFAWLGIVLLRSDLRQWFARDGVIWISAHNNENNIKEWEMKAAVHTQYGPPEVL